MTGKQQVLKAYRLVLGWLHRHHLEPGDRLPAQLALGRELGICQGTLSAAMQLLVEDGVIKRRQRAGTVVQHKWPQNPHRRIWTAGIVMPEPGPSGYVAALTVQLHRELANRNFSDRTYLISPQSVPASEVDHRDAADFLGLENDLEDGLVDALLTATRLICHEVPCVSLMDEEADRSKLSLHRDNTFFLESATAELAARGAKRIYMLDPEPEEAALVQGAAGPLGLEPVAIPVAKMTHSIKEWAIDNAISDLYSRHDGTPYGLIISDDYIAMLVSRRIAWHTSERPYIALQTHLRSGLLYSLPTLQYTTDLKIMSSTAVDLIVQQLLGMSHSTSRIKLPMSLQEVDDRPRAIPSLSGRPGASPKSR